MNYSDTVCVCTLGRIFGYEPRKGMRLIEEAGSAGKVFEAGKKELTRLLGPYSKYYASINVAELDRTARELERLEKNGFRYVCFNDRAYPELLKECEDPPLGLYLRASTEKEAVLNCGNYVSIIGTRNLSLYGREWCRKVVAALARAKQKPVIVSGLALGTDAAAHEAALEGGLRTVGVLPTGIEDVYPRRHEALAERICNAEGSGLISDYPPGTSPLAVNFLRRNRIIAGMSYATILIESRIKGGGMITARLAYSYDRDVYALPGRVDDWNSQGCNRLIQHKMAEAIGDIDALVDSLGLGSDAFRRKDSLAEEVEAMYKGTMPDADVDRLVRISLHIRSHRGIDTETLACELGLRYSELASCLTILESDGFISVDLLRRCSVRVRISA